MTENPQLTVMLLVIVFGSITLHEFGHAKSADSAGDPTPRAYGRVTLNPLSHFDPLGALMIVILTVYGVGIGWGRPVPVNPSRMQNPRWDGFMSVLWGPLTNVILAVGFAMLFRYVAPAFPGQMFAQFCFLGTLVNISLALFNLIPLGPLDGHWLLAYLLPQPLGARFAVWSRTQGTLILFAIILVDQVAFGTRGEPGILSAILIEPTRRILALLLGT